MDAKLQNLASILDRMVSLYHRVFEILDKERSALIALDHESMYSLLKEKDEILSAIRALDKDRLRIQDYFATIQGKDASEITLLSLGQSLMLQGGGAEKLGSMLLQKRNILTDLIDQLKSRIERNARFIEKSVENLRSIAENLSASVSGKSGAQAKKAGVYTDKAKYQQQQGATGSLVERRL